MLKSDDSDVPKLPTQNAALGIKKQTFQNIGILYSQGSYKHVFIKGYVYAIFPINMWHDVSVWVVIIDY